MKTPKTSYFLIDWENVQPKNLSHLKGHATVLAFIGANQQKLLAKIESDVLRLGNGSKCIPVSQLGRNALDFHIAFTLGELSKSDPDAIFNVISKDSGYDALLDYLRKLGFEADRADEIPQVPILRIAKSNAGPDELERIIQNLVSRGDNKPHNRTRLYKTINSLYDNSLSATQLTALVLKLEILGYIQFGNGETVIYRLPRSKGSPKRQVSAL